MSKEIYSEGRVVGASMYETYLKQHMAEFPDIPPASERQWLASSLAMGSSLLIKVPADNRTGTQIKSIALPMQSKLAAGNIILGSMFLGEAEFDNRGWARRITHYRGIDNSDSSSTPSTKPEDLADVKDILLNYLKLHDWSITFSDDWKPIAPPSSSPDDPYRDLKPDFSHGTSTLNIQYDGPLSTDVYVWLTGFTNKCILSGIVGDSGSIGTYPDGYPKGVENGAFLGPEIFPWAAPVTLMIPAEAGTIIGNIQEYARSYPTTVPAISVAQDAVIDYKYTNPANMIGTTGTQDFSDSLISVNVSELSYNIGNSSKAVLMARSYDVENKRPAGLYGGIISNTGVANLGPLDTYAPNTVKLFPTSAEAIDYETKVPHSYGLIRDDQNKSFYQVYNNTTIPIASVTNNPDGSVTVQAGLSSAVVSGQVSMDTTLRGEDTADRTLARTDWTAGEDFARTQLRTATHANVDAGAVAIGVADAPTTSHDHYSEYLALSLVTSDGGPLPMTGGGGRAKHVSTASRTSDIQDGINYSQLGWRQFLQALHANLYFDFFEPLRNGLVADTNSGIGLVWNDNQVTIKNTKPYDPVAEQASYVSLTDEPGKVEIYRLGSFVAYTSTPDAYDKYNPIQFDKDGYVPNTSAYVRPISMEITCSQDTSTISGFEDCPRSVTIHISGGSTHNGVRYILGNTSLLTRPSSSVSQSFQFRHASAEGSDGETKSRIMYIKFPDYEITVSGLTFNLQNLNRIRYSSGSQTVEGYRLIDNSTPDIWNVTQERKILTGEDAGKWSYPIKHLRATWPVYTNAGLLTVGHTPPVVCIRATSIGDGYNSQYSMYEDLMRTTNTDYEYSDELSTHWINLDVTYTLYLPR